MEEIRETEFAGPIVATSEPSTTEIAIAEMEQRIADLEAAMGELRTVKAEGHSVGRKTVSSSLMAKGTQADGSIDGALLSLSVEQRIAVKSGLMRAGLM